MISFKYCLKIFHFQFQNHFKKKIPKEKSFEIFQLFKLMRMFRFKYNCCHRNTLSTVRAYAHCSYVCCCRSGRRSFHALFSTLVHTNMLLSSSLIRFVVGVYAGFFFLRRCRCRRHNVYVYRIEMKWSMYPSVRTETRSINSDRMPWVLSCDFVNRFRF